MKTPLPAVGLSPSSESGKSPPPCSVTPCPDQGSILLFFFFYSSVFFLFLFLSILAALYTPTTSNLYKCNKRWVFWKCLLQAV